MEVIEYTTKNKSTGKAALELTYLMEGYHPDDLTWRLLATLAFIIQKQGRLVGIKHGKQMIGYAFMVYGVDNKRELLITDFAIYPEYRSKGLGAKALQAVLKKYVVPSAGCSLESSLDTVDFYLKSDFIEMKRQPNKEMRLLYYPAHTYHPNSDGRRFWQLDGSGLKDLPEEQQRKNAELVKKDFGLTIPLTPRLNKEKASI